MNLTPTPHSVEWYARLAAMQPGYFYPWRSQRAMWHGEDFFLPLVFEHLKPELDVLEVACAQGDLALAIAPHVHTVLGFDATADYIALARKAAAERGLGNTTFLVHNSSAAANGGRPRLPAADDSIDLWLNSKGPWSTILDTPRVCRPGAVMLMLVAEDNPPMPWEDWLPEPLRRQPFPDDDPRWARHKIERLMGEAGLRLHSWWDFDTPEIFPGPEDLYAVRTFGYAPGEAPSYDEAAPALARIYQEFASPEGLEVRWIRHVWKAVV